MSKPSPLETEVYFIDYGNTEVVQPADLKPFRAASAGDGAGPADLSASNEDGDGDNGVYSFVGGEEDDNVYGNVEATPETDLTPELRADRDVVLRAVEQCGRDLEFASPELQDDEEVVKTALDNFTSFEYVSKSLRSNPEIVLSGLSKSNGFEFISHNFEDRDFALNAIKIDSAIAENFPPKFLSDREFILAAVKIDGNALVYASDELRSDPELAKIALSDSSFDVEYAREECPEILDAAGL